MANMRLTSPEVDLVTINFTQLSRIKIDQLPKLELLELKGFKSSEFEDDDSSMYATEIIRGVYFHTCNPR